MNNPITEPVPGFYLIAGSGNWKLPARISRLCNCTINGEEEHEWRDSCDRYPPLVLEIAGRVQDETHDPIAAVWANAEPLLGHGGLSPAQEYAYQVAKAAHRIRHGAPDMNTAKPLF